MCHWAVLGKEEGGAGGVGGHILAVNDVYGGTSRMLSRTSRPLGIETTYLSFQDGEESIRRALRPDTKVSKLAPTRLTQIIWLECPTNPTLTVPPLPLIASIVESLSNPPVVLIDTTFLSSFYFAPLLSDPPLADLVLSSLTKYTGGHTDIIMGAVVASGRAQERHPNIVKGLRFLQNSLGATASPRDCHLMLRSAKTLTVRMIRHGLNALRIAAWLQSRSEIADVLYPGLATDPAFPSVQQLISPHAKRELNFLGWTFPYDPAPDPSPLASVRALGIPFGGVLSFKLKATEEQIDVFVQNLRLTALAVSLGGVESLLEAPSSMTHDVSKRSYFLLRSGTLGRNSRSAWHHSRPHPLLRRLGRRRRYHRGPCSSARRHGSVTHISSPALPL